jgi:hypothetical protein
VDITKSKYYILDMEKEETHYSFLRGVAAAEVGG